MAKSHGGRSGTAGYHPAGATASSLSCGELQKAALARALTTQPAVLLLDEPFSYLDQASSVLLEQFISDYSSGSQGTLIKSPLINLFHGQTEQHIFDTGKIKIMLVGEVSNCRHVSIDPNEIVLSRQPLISSIRNQFQGRVTTIGEKVDKVRRGERW